MSTVDLVILGLLIKKPRSAYDLSKFVIDNHYSFMVGVSVPAIYKNTVRLAQNGFLAATPCRQARMPEKKIYSVTDAGREYYERLLEEYSKADAGCGFDFNAVVLNLGNVSKAEGMALLNGLKARLSDEENFFYEAAAGKLFTTTAGRMIFRQRQLVSQALLAWVDEVLEQYEGEYGSTSSAGSEGREKYE
jgi:DNA-binding PadR family transcriptional regulator